MFAQTPEPPYYAVIFSTLLTEDYDGYVETIDEMIALAEQQPGFLGIERARNGKEQGGLGISVSYWASLDAINVWRNNADHMAVKGKGRKKWYRAYRLRITKVEKDGTWEVGG
ncbi:MAG: antibiotic biosynthesis monooxygenase [Rhodospirillaceae bacterium]|jgi:heme-degrading monooxygenase HmoA|nr:antibiotic biosynthesis monooxygenase [Rhodospirillaceae bacterium]MBT5374037.1 antibiotic biosynthesis monooxygenase [Rhodospirillaceae bacterium]MBT5660235.1 antibiotic biosynthesis monooxygenase [Rhodospirillaceae bacterium]MBT5752393.1 antibiotic biosynthesis monooxygenase [Rhodospirillaceae bacterium]